MDISYEQTIYECNISTTKLSMRTVADWYSYCRETCMVALDSYYSEGKIGGQGTIVEIDESKVGHRKYNRGRMVEGTWIFGMIERDNDQIGSFRLEICTDNKRDSATLIPFILKHVKKGTKIMSDCWIALQNMDMYMKR